MWTHASTQIYMCVYVVWCECKQMIYIHVSTHIYKCIYSERAVKFAVYVPYLFHDLFLRCTFACLVCVCVRVRVCVCVCLWERVCGCVCSTSTGMDLVTAIESFVLQYVLQCSEWLLSHVVQCVLQWMSFKSRIPVWMWTRGSVKIAVYVPCVPWLTSKLCLWMSGVRACVRVCVCVCVCVLCVYRYGCGQGNRVCEMRPER